MPQVLVTGGAEFLGGFQKPYLLRDRLRVTSNDRGIAAVQP